MPTARLQFQNYLLIFAAATFEGLFCMVKTFLSMINRLILCFTLLFSTTYGIKAINVRDCGAIGDGKHIDSPAINSAIEKAALTGDTVIVPAGTFMCYSLHLRSNITLRLERGAVIKAAPVTKTDGYDRAQPLAQLLDMGRGPA